MNEDSFFKPGIAIGLGFLHSVTTMERLSLGAISCAGRVFTSFDSVKKATGYAEYLHEQSYDTHLKILKVFQKIMRRPELDAQKNSALYRDLYKKCQLLSNKARSSNDILNCFREFFSSCCENEAIKMFHFDSQGEMNLDHFFSLARSNEDDKIENHFIQACVDYGMRSFDYFKGFLFFIFRRENQSGIPRLIGLNLRQKFKPNLENLVKRRFWMDAILELYPLKVQMSFRDRFSDFVLDVTNYDPAICLRAVSNPNKFFNPKDLSRWIFDSRVTKYDLAQIFSDYMLNPQEFSCLFEGFPQFNLSEKKKLLELLCFVKILETDCSTSNYLDQNNVLAHLLSKKKLEEVKVLISHLIFLTAKDEHKECKTFLDYLCDLFSCKIFWDSKKDLISFSKKPPRHQEMSVIEYLLLKMGNTFVHLLVSSWAKTDLHPFFLKRFILAIFQSKSYPFYFEGFFNQHAFDFNIKVKKEGLSSFECIHHPFFLLHQNGSRDVDSKVINYLMCDEYPFSGFDDAYAFNSFALLLSVFSSAKSWSALEGFSDPNAQPLIASYEKISVVEDLKKKVIGIVTCDFQTFLKHFIKYLKGSLELVISHTIFAKNYRHVTHELCNIKGLLEYLKLESEYPLVRIALQGVFDEILATDLQPYDSRLMSILQVHLDLADQNHPTLYPLNNLVGLYLQNLSEQYSLAAGLSKFELCLNTRDSFVASVMSSLSFLGLERVNYLEAIIENFFANLQREELTWEHVLRISEKYAKSLEYAFDGLDEAEELNNLFGFHHFLIWMMNDVIEKERVPHGFLNKVELERNIRDISIRARPYQGPLQDFLVFLLKYQNLKKLGKASYQICESMSQELERSQLEAIDAKGKILSKLESFTNSLSAKTSRGPGLKLQAGDLAGLMQELRNILPANEDLIHPFYAFAGLSDSVSFEEAKAELKRVFNQHLRTNQDFPPLLLGKILVLVERLKSVIFVFDPLRLNELIEIFDRIQFIEIDDQTDEIEGPYAVATTILDDTGAPFTPEVLRNNLCRLLGFVSRRDLVLAVPTSKTARHSYYQQLEAKLFIFKNLVLDSISKHEKLELVGPLICNLSIAGAHCATRWVMEVDGAIDAMSSHNLSQSFELVFLTNLQQLRKKVVMNMIEVLFEDELDRFGIEALIHPFNYLRSRYHKELGLQRATEGLFDEELMAELEEKIESFEFFDQIEQGVLQQILKLIFHKKEEGEYFKLLDEALIKYSFNRYKKKTWHHFFEMDLPEFNEFRSEVYEYVRGVKSLILDADEDDLSTQSIREITLLKKCIAVFKSGSCQYSLETRGLVSLRVFDMAFDALLKNQLSDQLLTELTSTSLTTVSQETLREVHRVLGDELSSNEKEAFFDIFRSDALVRAKFVFWNEKRTLGNVIEVLKAYYRGIITTVLKLIGQSQEPILESEQRLLITKIPIDSHLSTSPKMEFLIDGFLEIGDRDVYPNLIRDYIIIEQALDLMKFFHGKGLTSFNMKESRYMLEGYTRQRGHKKGRFINRLIWEAFEGFHKEAYNLVLASRPTLKYRLIFDKLKEEKFIV